MNNTVFSNSYLKLKLFAGTSTSFAVPENSSFHKRICRSVCEITGDFTANCFEYYLNFKGNKRF